VCALSIAPSRALLPQSHSVAEGYVVRFESTKALSAMSSCDSDGYGAAMPLRDHAGRRAMSSTGDTSDGADPLVGHPLSFSDTTAELSSPNSAGPRAGQLTDEFRLDNDDDDEDHNNNNGVGGGGGRGGGLDAPGMAHIPGRLNSTPTEPPRKLSTPDKQISVLSLQRAKLRSFMSGMTATPLSSRVASNAEVQDLVRGREQELRADLDMTATAAATVAAVVQPRTEGESIRLVPKPGTENGDTLEIATIDSDSLTDDSSGKTRDKTPATVYSLLYEHRVGFDAIKRMDGRLYHVLRIIKRLISVASNAGPIMEMWPPAFRTYNCLVPNFLNLPFLLWGVAAPRSMVSLALYYASRGADCSYCTLHTCIFALRRGAPAESVMGTHLSAKEAAVARMAFAMGCQPCRLTDVERGLLREHFSESNEEWIVIATCMMGFLNRWMDVTRVDFEGTAMVEADEVLSSELTGFDLKNIVTSAPQGELQVPDRRVPKKDTLFTNFALFRHIVSTAFVSDVLG
jgi:hypothetical protein